MPDLKPPVEPIMMGTELPLTQAWANFFDQLAQADYSRLGDYADDPAAGVAGVVVGGLYRTGSFVKVRVA